MRRRAAGERPVGSGSPRRRRRRALCAALSLLAAAVVAGCGGGEADAEGESRSASGESASHASETNAADEYRKLFGALSEAEVAALGEARGELTPRVESTLARRNTQMLLARLFWATKLELCDWGIDYSPPSIRACPISTRSRDSRIFLRPTRRTRGSRDHRMRAPRPRWRWCGWGVTWAGNPCSSTITRSCSFERHRRWCSSTRARGARALARRCWLCWRRSTKSIR